MARSKKKDFGLNPVANGILQALPQALFDAVLIGGAVILNKGNWKINSLLNGVLPTLGAVGISALTFSQVMPKLQAIQAQRIQESQGNQGTQAVSSK
jgi:formate hydrogenlyase subunit 4